LQSLKQNSLGLVSAATLGVVMLSPAMTLYGNFGAALRLLATRRRSRLSGLC
jgi:hypothetical protein